MQKKQEKKLIEIDEIRFIHKPSDKGFKGFLSFVIDKGFYCGDIAVLERDGEIILKYPLKDKERRYFYHRPINKDTEDYINEVCIEEIKKELMRWKENYDVE